MHLRLATEMEDRRSLQQLLPEYFGFLKASAVRNDEMLRSVREKVEKLEQEKTSVCFYHFLIDKKMIIRFYG